MGRSDDSTDVKPRVFLSYSRQDTDHAEWLRDALVEEGFDAYLDVHDIAMGEAWRTRLIDLIAKAEKIIFLVSPSAVASEICGWEVDQAEKHGKTILPVVCREVGHDKVPDRLSRLNFTFMRDNEERGQNLAGLVSALRLDLPWEREKARITDDAVAWDLAKRPNRLLLFSKDAIREAEVWRDARPALAPALTEVQTAFINESRKRRSVIQRRVTIASALIACFMAVAAVFAVVQGQRAIASEKIATTRAAIMSAGTAGDLAENGSTDGALLLLLDASESFAETTAPDALLIGFDRALRSASGKTRYALPATTRGFSVPSGLILHDPVTGDVAFFDGSSKPISFGILSGNIMAVEPTFMGPGVLVALKDGEELSVASIDYARQHVREIGRVPGFPAGPNVYVQISSSGVVFANDPFADPPNSLLFDSRTGITRQFGDQIAKYGDIATDSAADNFLLPAINMAENPILKLGEDFSLTPVKTDQDTFARLRFDRCIGTAVADPQAKATRAALTSDDLSSLFVWTGSSMIMETSSFGDMSCNRHDKMVMIHLNVLANRVANRQTTLLGFGDGVPAFQYMNGTAKSANISAYWKNDAGEFDERSNFTIADPNFSDIRIFEADTENRYPREPLSVISENSVIEALVAPEPNRILVLRAAGVTNSDAPIDLRLAAYNLKEVQGYGKSYSDLHSDGNEDRRPSGAAIMLRSKICAKSYSDDVVVDEISIPSGFIRIGLSDQDAEAIDAAFLEFMSPDRELISRTDLDWSGRRSYSLCAKLSHRRDWLIVQDGAGQLLMSTTPGDGAAINHARRLQIHASSVDFFAEGPSLISTDASSGNVIRHTPSETSTTGWDAELIFSGRRQVIDAQSDASGKRLLIVESPDGPLRRGFVHSLDADQNWRDVGEGFRTLEVDFLEDGSVVSESGWGGEINKLHTLEEAVAAAKDAIAVECLPIEPNAWSASPCWPSGY